MGRLLITANPNPNELRHEGIRVGEIIAYRAWRVMERTWLGRDDDRLHSVFIRDYVWHPHLPASGDIREYGIYSFRHVIRSREECTYDFSEALIFGKVKIWGEIIEHERGYRSEFAKIVSLDYGEDQELLDKFRRIYRVN